MGSAQRHEWLRAELTTPLSGEAWVQWQVVTELEPGDHIATVRATDGTGETQTSVTRDPLPGAATGWHSRRFRTS